MLGALLIHILLVLVGCGIPLLPQLFGSSVQTSGQHWTMRLLNPYVTLSDFSRGAVDPIERIGIVTVLGGFAACALLLNFRSIVAEMNLVHEAAPQRVQEDDAVLTPAEPQGPLNPWDEEGQ